MPAPDLPSKTCSRCDQTKPVADFYRRSDSSDGFASLCKVCDRDRKRRDGDEPDEPVDPRHGRRSASRSKTCTRCGDTKPGREFYARSDTADGLMSHCKACDNARRHDNGQTSAALRRSRVYNRAVAALIDAHPDEFRRLQDRIRAEVDAEADRLSAAAGLTEGDDVLLRSGPAGRGETVSDRVQRARRRQVDT